MKSLIIIWLLVLVTLVGGTVYMSHEIEELIKEVPRDSVKINYCDTSGMVNLSHSECVLTAFNSLEVVNNYGEQKTANINVLEPKVSDAYLQGGYNQ